LALARPPNFRARPRWARGVRPAGGSPVTVPIQSGFCVSARSSRAKGGQIGGKRRVGALTATAAK
jgi:hypothetical protein